MIQNYLTLLTTPVAWHERSIRALAAWSELKVLEPFGLTLGSYSTVRMVRGRQFEQTNWAWRWPLIPGFSFGIEELPGTLEHLATDQGTSLVKISKLDEGDVCSSIQSACKLIEELDPALFLSVRTLLRSLHILESPDLNFDLSFSLPELPNSVFLSIPSSGECDSVPRLAENIVHGVLHLQLSIVERFCPLVFPDADEELIYAPWRDEHRQISGVLQGLFVFRGVEALWSRLTHDQCSCMSNFARARVDEIRRHCRLVEPMEYDSLTPFGQQFFLRMASPLGVKS